MLVLVLQLIILWGVYHPRKVSLVAQSNSVQSGMSMVSFGNRQQSGGMPQLQGNPLRAMDAMIAGAFKDMAQLHSAMQIDDGWDRLSLSPTMDMRSSKNGYLVSLSIPGVDAGNLNVALDGRVLSVSARTALGGNSSHGYRSFDRRILLPGAVGSVSDMRASVTNGLLRIYVPKGSNINQPYVKIKLY